ncbi:MAG: hypothetical protein GC206_10215 [Alphaproteobacteria bacterium]|nr:hypothetical protein [Alphaproteobacteria bacterium]
MTEGEWRALIEAYLEGRLSAEAFERRFNEAWRAARERGGSIPAAIEQLALAVEDFARAQDARTEYDADEGPLRNAARIAARDLRDDADPARDGRPRTFDRARAREDMRRFQVHVGRMAGLGCLFAIGWLVLMVLQINFAIEQVAAELELGVWLSAIVGFFTAFVPVLGNIVAFFGAKDVGGWPGELAALVFFVLPVAALFYGRTRWRTWRAR